MKKNQKRKGKNEKEESVHQCITFSLGLVIARHRFICMLKNGFVRIAAIAPAANAISKGKVELEADSRTRTTWNQTG